MKPFALFILAIFTILTIQVRLSAQVCAYSQLSEYNKFKVTLKRTVNAKDSLEERVIRVDIIPKGAVDFRSSFSINAGFLFDTVFKNCDFVRSYTTGKNKNMEVSDNDYGDFIVADFNFDGREDFAVKYHSGGNGGPIYQYYTQYSYGKFVRDAYLSDTMQYFPTSMNRHKKTLIIMVHANAYQMGETVFKVDARNHWTKVSHRFLNAN